MAGCRCTRCDGTRRIIRLLNWDSEKVKCTRCNGTGIEPKMQCPTCGGSGRVWAPLDGVLVYCWDCDGEGVR